MALVSLYLWHVSMFWPLHLNFFCCSNFLTEILQARPTVHGLVLEPMLLYSIKVTASNFLITVHQTYQLQNWLLASVVIKLSSVLLQTHPLLKLNTLTTSRLLHASFYTYTTVWATRGSQSYRSGPLKASMGFQATLPTAQSQCVKPVSMVQ